MLAPRSTLVALLTGLVLCLVLPSAARAQDGPLVLSPLAVVDKVKDNFFAAKAGIRPGDMVVELDGKKNPTLEEVLAHYYDYHNARDIKLVLKRLILAFHVVVLRDAIPGATQRRRDDLRR